MQFLDECKQSLPQAAYVAVNTMLVAFKMKLLSELQADESILYLLAPFPALQKQYNIIMQNSAYRSTRALRNGTPNDVLTGLIDNFALFDEEEVVTYTEQHTASCFRADPGESNSGVKRSYSDFLSLGSPSSTGIHWQSEDVPPGNMLKRKHSTGVGG